MIDCLFCKIIAGDIPSQKLYEDEHTFAFLDIKPNNPGHTLVVPKIHARNVFDITEESWRNIAPTIKKLAPALKNALKADGLNVAMNNEGAAGQIIFHAHIHLIPRFANDGYRLWKSKEMPEKDLVSIAEKIRQHL